METGLDHRGARMYDGDVGRFLGVDPLADVRSWVTPFNYVQNNPIFRVDPDGALDAPIYDEDGNFLGTDDEGLQGKAIIMDKDNFTQGMSHGDALKNSLGAEGLSSDGAKTKFLDHYNGLKDRPDYDSKLTFGEAIKHFNEGSGAPLFIDARKINLNATSVPELKADDDGYINFFPVSHPNTSLVYGTIKLTLLNENTGVVRLGGAGNLLDRFDFDPKKPFGRIADGLYPWKTKEF
jgi:uncharacterized protein RhaS with RHS repeats